MLDDAYVTIHCNGCPQSVDILLHEGATGEYIFDNEDLENCGWEFVDEHEHYCTDCVYKRQKQSENDIKNV